MPCFSFAFKDACTELQSMVIDLGLLTYIEQLSQGM